MRNLFSVGLFRMVRSKLFYILLALTALVMAYVYYNTYRVQLGPDFSQLDLYFFQFINANIVSAAVFCPLFLSSEYGDGALRNKLIVGRTRPQIYLANLTVNCLYGTAACLAAVVTGLCVGVPLLGWFQNAGPGKIMLYVLLALATTWVCAALYTFLSMVVASRGVAITLCILLAFGLILLGQYLYLALSQEEVLTALFYTDTGEMAVSEQPNPAYLTGFTRQVYQFFYELTPGGQAYQILGMSAQSPLRMLGYSGLVFVLVTGLGLAIFQKKDVK